MEYLQGIYVIVLFINLINLEICNGGKLWQPPDGRTREEWFECGGLDCEEWEQVQQLLREMENIGNDPDLGANKESMKDTIPDVFRDGPGETAAQVSEMSGCVRYTAEQAAVMLDNMYRYQEQSRHRRRRRKIENFEKMPDHRWENPIIYKFDGGHSEEEQELIRGAIRHLQEQTCLRFFEFPLSAPVSKTHLLFTNANQGCWSFVGKLGKNPQFLNLADVCLKEFGTPVHEIGHSLGMWHEQQRPDRDGYIRILLENIGYYKSQFFPVYGSIMLGVEYDHGSIMHYSSKAGTKNAGYTIEALNKRYQKNMGQRNGLSFLDSKLINRAYCNATCAYPLPRICQRRGYQDPNNCDRCRCPDGFTGKYCQKLKPSPAGCGGQIIASYTPQNITSPGYPETYSDRQECSWLIKAPRRHRVQLTFEGMFGLYCKSFLICQHWLEVRYSKELGLPGPRLCCYQTPRETIKSKKKKVPTATLR